MSFVGKGTKLNLHTGSEYETIALRVSVSGPSVTVGTVETTHLDSTGKEFLPTLPDWGEVSLTFNYNPKEQTTHSQLTALLTTPAVKQWQIVYPTAIATTIAFNGILTSFNVSGVESEGLVQAECTIKITGTPTITTT